MDSIFRDRVDAGRRLSEHLRHYQGRGDLVVLALPRGGVPVGYQVAQALQAPLDVMVVRKLGVPGHEELAMGAIASGGVRVVNEEVLHMLGAPDALVDRVAAQEEVELARRERAYRGDRPPVQVEGRVVILIDDGLATGATMRAAVSALKRRGPARIVVAVPVGAEEACHELRAEADEVVCAATPSPFFGVGAWYEDFAQTTDDEVRELLERAAAAGRTERE
ncbi:phosphoribosyltransferase [Candidatus Nitrospira bockiana]